MKILIWHVHGGWMEAFVHTPHEVLLPTTLEGGAWGLGRGGRAWPARAVEVAADDLRNTDLDVVILQRPEELARVEALTGRRPGRDLPAVYLEHNTPRPDAVSTRHPIADRHDIPLVHVTHFNRLVWDSGDAPTVVIEHGVPDHGSGYSGHLARMAVIMNEPVRRARVVGADLLPKFLTAGGIDVYGIGVDALPAAVDDDRGQITAMGDLPSDDLHASIAERRLYLHLTRWTSLGLSLIEAMTLGMPVVVLETTEAGRAVPPGAGFVSTNVDELVAAARVLLADPGEAARLGSAARAAALDRYGLARFLRDWDALLTDVVERTRRSPNGLHDPNDFRERSLHAYRHGV